MPGERYLIYVPLSDRLSSKWEKAYAAVMKLAKQDIVLKSFDLGLCDANIQVSSKNMAP